MLTRGWAIGFWALVLLVPGGLLLLPVWLVRQRRARERQLVPVPVTCGEAPR